jgi:hypothetical protein
MKSSFGLAAAALCVFVGVACGCGVEASEEGQCGQGEVFAQPEGLLPLCYPVCQQASGCDAGLECAQVDGVAQSVCIPPPPECAVDGDCVQGELCQQGSCVVDESVGRCEDDRGCGEGELCESGECVPGAQAVGARCERACQNLYGSCTRQLCSGLAPYVADALATEYVRCIEGGVDAEGVNQDSCADRYGVDQEHTELVDLYAAQECGASEVLEEAHCELLDLGGACGCSELNLGEACTRNSECTGGYLPSYCATQYPGGYCASITCNVGTGGNLDFNVGPGTGCGNDGVCQNFTSPTTGEIEGICLRACTTNQDCRQGYACERMGELVGPGMIGRCLPACTTSADCRTYTYNGSTIPSYCSDLGVCETPCTPGVSRCAWLQTCQERPGFNPAPDITGSCTL